MKHFLSILLIFFFFKGIFSQNGNLDSLVTITNALDDSDTNKVFDYCDIAFKYAGNGELDKALDVLKKAEPYLKKFNNKRMTALYYYVAGRTHYSKGNSKESLSYLLNGMKLFEQQNNKAKVSACCNIIGLIFQDQTLYEKAHVFLKKSLDLRIELQDSMRLSGIYSNLGLNYHKLASKKKVNHEDSYEMREAIKNLNAALVIAKRLKLPSAEASALGNLSIAMNDREKYAEAKLFAEKALKIYQNLGDIHQEAISLIDVASVLLAQNKPQEAIPYLQRSLTICTTNGLKELERYIYGNLATAAEKMGDYKQAFNYEKKLIVLNDSAFNSENLKQINEMQIKYDTEKKETENAFLTEKNELSDKAIKNQKTAIIFIIGGLLSTLALTFFIFRGFKKQKRANHIISLQKKEVEKKNDLINEQKELLEAKQKEIIDSINYAKRIQQAHMPSDKYVAKNLDRLKK